MLAAFGIHRGLFSSAAKGELDVGILLVKSVVIEEMLCLEDNDDEGAQFLRHCELNLWTGSEMMAGVTTGVDYKASPKQGSVIELFVDLIY